MLKVKYPFDGENRNEPLENLVYDFLRDHAFEECGKDIEETDSAKLMVLEYESVEDESASDMNEHEQGFVNGEDGNREMLEAMVGNPMPLLFEFEPWDDDDERFEDDDEEEAPTPAPVSDKKIMYFGWCNQTDSKGTHDKVWGVISAQREWITFWGGRNKKLTFKKADDYSTGDSLETLIRSKQRKGYNATTMEEMNRLDPQFETRFEEELILAMMADKFHHA